MPRNTTKKETAVMENTSTAVDETPETAENVEETIGTPEESTTAETPEVAPDTVELPTTPEIAESVAEGIVPAAEVITEPIAEVVSEPVIEPTAEVSLVEDVTPIETLEAIQPVGDLSVNEDFTNFTDEQKAEREREFLNWRFSHPYADGPFLAYWSKYFRGY